ncbi:hypothetical protein WA026_005924 [Henosepilachna vigintioctopunctata]|uniref:Uncharacterized protein n=1 Tax=Henosepilachna vigintioctopunctata TaxID=420089 RepID=A0AAW1U5H8_9CUCU
MSTDLPYRIPRRYNYQNPNFLQSISRWLFAKHINNNVSSFTLCDNFYSHNCAHPNTNHRGNYFTLARQSTIAKITHYVVGSSHTCFACLESGLENRRFDTTSLEANSIASQKSSIETDRLSAVHKLLKCNYLPL